MHFDQIKSLQIAYLTLTAVYAKGIAHPVAFALLVPFTLITGNKFYANTILSFLISAISYTSGMQ